MDIYRHIFYKSENEGVYKLIKEEEKYYWRWIRWCEGGYPHWNISSTRLENEDRHDNVYRVPVKFLFRETDI